MFQTSLPYIVHIIYIYIYVRKINKGLAYDLHIPGMNHWRSKQKEVVRTDRLNRPVGSSESTVQRNGCELVE